MRSIAHWLAAWALLTPLVATYASNWRLQTLGRDFFNLDPSWQAALHEFAASDIQWGRDIVFTFGPWGFVDAEIYHPQTWAAYLAANLLLVAAFVAISLRVGRLMGAGPWRSALVAGPILCVAASGVMELGLIAVMGTAIWLERESDAKPTDPVRSLDAAAPAKIGHASPAGREASPGHQAPAGRESAAFRWGGFSVQFSLLETVAGLLFSFLSLIKHSYAAAAVITIVALGTSQLLRKRVSPLIPSYAIGLLLFWLLAGQSLSAIPAYLSGSWQIVSGYSDAMSYPTVERRPNTELAVMLLMGWSVLFAGLAVAVLALRAGFRSAPLWMILAGVTAIALKHAITRADPGHLATMLLFMFPISSLLLLLSLPATRRPRPARSDEGPTPRARRRAYAPIAVTGAAAMLTASALLAPVVYWRPAWTRLAAPHAAAMFNAIFAADALDAEREERQELFRRTFSVEPFAGRTFDMLGHHQSVALVSGLDYIPRPVFQSYSAYTEPLLERNRLHLETTGTEALGVTFGHFDRRLPAHNFEGYLWPDLIANYRPIGFTGLPRGDRAFRILLLGRRPEPLATERRVLFDEEVRAGQWIPVDVEGPSKLVWAEIDIRPSLAGRLIGVGYKRNPVAIDIAVHAGEPMARWRLIPDAARAGFLLSPHVIDVDHLAAVIGGPRAPLPPEVRVAAVRIGELESFVPAWTWRDTFRVRLLTLEFKSQDEPAAR